MESIDKLTLELLMNKNTYNRYIEKTDPRKHKEEQEFRRKLKKYKSRIIQMTMKFLDDPDFQVNNELNDMFSEYSKTFVKYFEMNDLEVSCFYGSTKEPDDEVMFEPSKMEESVADFTCSMRNSGKYVEEDADVEVEDADVEDVEVEDADADDIEISSIAATVGKEYKQKPYFSSISNNNKNSYTMDKYVLRK